MSKEVVVSRLPNCDICSTEGKTVPAEFDSRTSLGNWANLCKTHFAYYGTGLGTGRGQRLVLKGTGGHTPKLGKNPYSRIIVKPTQEDLEEAVHEGLWHPECPFCGGYASAEPDAGETCCPECGKHFEIGRCC